MEGAHQDGDIQEDGHAFDKGMQFSGIYTYKGSSVCTKVTFIYGTIYELNATLQKSDKYLGVICVN